MSETIKIINISAKMLEQSVPADFVKKVSLLALSIDGIVDLMEIWDESEKDADERAEIIKALSEHVREQGWASNASRITLPMKTIFTVTGVSFTDDDIERARVWGWYELFVDAEQAVINNATDMNEAGWFPYLLIEEVAWGILPRIHPDKQAWYFYDPSANKYNRVPAPPQVSTTFNFSMG